jgi:hypothetical protein
LVGGEKKDEKYHRHPNSTPSSIPIHHPPSPIQPAIIISPICAPRQRPSASSPVSPGVRWSIAAVYPLYFAIEFPSAPCPLVVLLRPALPSEAPAYALVPASITVLVPGRSRFCLAPGPVTLRLHHIFATQGP